MPWLFSLHHVRILDAEGRIQDTSDAPTFPTHVIVQAL